MSIRDELNSFKKERILGEASRLFYERGYRGTSLDAIAEALEVTKPFIYYHYDKKSDLLLEIYKRIVGYSIQSITAARALDLTPTEKLRSFALTFTEVVIREQMGVAVFLREESSIPPEHLKEINCLRTDFDDALAGLLEEGVAAGEFNVEDTRMTTLALGGMMSWVYTWYRASGRLVPKDIAQQMAAMALRVAGVGVP